MIRCFVRLAMVGATLACATHGYAQPDQSLLVIPANSPVHLQSRNEDEGLQAKFAGRFVLTGTFRYGCADGCRKPVEKSEMRLDFAPDRELAARLPHWQGYTTRPIIEIDGSAAFAAKVVSKQAMRSLELGRTKWVTGRVSIIVDQLQTGIDCDAAWYSARFVETASPANIKAMRLAGDVGCE